MGCEPGKVNTAEPWAQEKGGEILICLQILLTCLFHYYNLTYSHLKFLKVAQDFQKTLDGSNPPATVLGQGGSSRGLEDGTGGSQRPISGEGGHQGLQCLCWWMSGGGGSQVWLLGGTSSSL